MAKAGASAAAGSQAITLELALPTNHAGKSLGLGDGGVIGDVVTGRVVGGIVDAGAVIDGAAIGIAVVGRTRHVGRGKGQGSAKKPRFVRPGEGGLSQQTETVVESGYEWVHSDGRPDAPDTGGKRRRDKQATGGGAGKGGLHRPRRK